MRTDEVRDFLRQRGARGKESAIQNGTQFRCESGEVINVYDSGKVVVGGKQGDLAKALLAVSNDVTTAGPTATRSPSTTISSDPSRQIFIVYGHDISARNGLELVLRRMGLEPIVLANLPAGGDTIIEKLEHYLGGSGNVGFACVLLTPDDEGYLAGKPEDKHYRARQNVVLELGMVLARLGRERVAIIHKATVELPSDISGLIYIAFQERIEEVTAPLFKELENAGYKPRASAL
jgi:predicted nucleotide-binding protein